MKPAIIKGALGIGALGGVTIRGYYAFNKEETSNKVTEERHPATQDNSLSNQQEALAGSPSERTTTVEAQNRDETGSSSVSTTTSASNTEATSSTGARGIVAEAK